jgi:hypothetical protein
MLCELPMPMLVSGANANANEAVPVLMVQVPKGRRMCFETLPN